MKRPAEAGQMYDQPIVAETEHTDGARWVAQSIAPVVAVESKRSAGGYDDGRRARA